MVDLQGADKGNISLPFSLQNNPTPGNERSMILNMQIAMYDILIRDLKNKVARLEERNQHLRSFCDKVQAKVDFDAEAEKEIVDLENEIASTINTIDKTKRDFDEIDKRRNARKKAHLEQVKEMEEKFEKTKIQYCSEIKVINAKINAIDDYKLAYEGLKAKYDSLNELYYQKEQKLEEMFDQIEFKIKMHRENLKKEVYKQILEVSDQFQIDLRTTIPSTLQRLMRENIVLENELVRLWHDFHIMEAEEEKIQKSLNGQSKIIKESQTAIRRRLISMKIEKSLITKMQEKWKNVKAELSLLPEPQSNFEYRYSVLKTNLAQDPELVDKDYRKRRLEVLLHREYIDLTLTNKMKNDTEVALKNCGDTLMTLKNVVHSILMLDDFGSKEDVNIPNVESMESGYAEMDLQTLCLELLKIINAGEARKCIAETVSTVTMHPLDIYQEQDLGFDPEPIVFEDDIKKPPVLILPSMSASSTEKVAESEETSKDLESEEKSLATAKEAPSDYLEIGPEEFEYEDEEHDYHYGMDQFFDYMYDRQD